VKVTINGEVFEYDPDRKPMSEALAIEAGLGMPYAAYEEGLRAGSAKSVAGFIWSVWKRNGRDVPLADILSGKVDVDLNALDIDAGDAEGDETGPTTPTPTATSTTGGSTSGSSPKSSGSSRGRSAS
jgi:hypothetical protein